MSSNTFPFSLPGVDDPAEVETGVILMGLDRERLLAGLGVASLAEDPALVALAVDHLRHGAAVDAPMTAVVAAGIRCWRASRAALTVAEPRGQAVSAAPRQAWTRVLGLTGSACPDRGPAVRSYLAACWLRRDEVDRLVEDDRAVPEVTA
ncbi:DUF6187 family protein [Amycolatopsis antarctica]|uniref:DUF6187 family protein n=1 Tax=Amycolatopsis antarctica TaxID=1854586 RepID=UPI0010561227|nr:DUF6187 family protein [Amycolatopsis antarctica]